MPFSLPDELFAKSGHASKLTHPRCVPRGGLQKQDSLLGHIAKSLPVLHANAMPLSIRWARRSLQDGDLSAPVPLDDIVIERWGLASGLRLPETGRLDLRQRLQLRQDSLWPDSLRSKVLQPTARRVGIVKQIGWHTFRRTYSSLLAATGDDVKVVHSQVEALFHGAGNAGWSQENPYCS